MKFTKQDAAQMAEYIELTDDLLTKQAAEIAQLKEESQRVQKQAADVSQPVLSQDKIAATVADLITAGLAKESERKDLLKHLETPENVLDALNKVASVRAKSAGTVPPMGKVASTGKVSTGKRESDTHFERQFGR